MIGLVAVGALAAEPHASRPAVDLLVGEALVEQSSGRHRPQPAVLVGASLPLSGGLGLAAEALFTAAADGAALGALEQRVARPALLATLTLTRPGATPDLAFGLGVGPAVTVTVASWSTPRLEPVTLVEPGARGRASLAVAVGARFALRAQGGLAWRASGVDHDYSLGVAWAW